jgi:protein SCO1/2
VYGVLRSCIAAGLLILLAACGGNDAAVTGFHELNSDGMHGAVMPTPYTLPDATLTESHGDPYDLRADTTKPVTMVFFGYTYCPDICQVVMADLTAAVARLDKADQAKVGLLFITSDPTRDDPKTLRTYLDRFNPSFEGLTAPIGEIKQVANALGVAIEKGDKLPSGGYAVAHGTQIVGVLADGTAPLIWTDGTSSADLAADLTKALHDGIPKVGSDE